jgi:HK97 family phage major capsid protein
MKLKIKQLNELCPGAIGSVVSADNKEAIELAKELISKGIVEEYTAELELSEKSATIKQEAKSMSAQVEVKDVKVDQKDDPMVIKSFGEWMQCVTKEPSKLKLTQKANGMSEGVNADGGYLLTPQITSEIFGATIPGSVIYPKCFKIPLQSSSIKLPIFNDTGDTATSKPRGYPVTPDGTQKTATTFALTQKTVSLVTWS